MRFFKFLIKLFLLVILILGIQWAYKNGLVHFGSQKAQKESIRIIKKAKDITLNRIKGNISSTLKKPNKIPQEEKIPEVNVLIPSEEMVKTREEKEQEFSQMMQEARKNILKNYNSILEK